MDLTYLSKDGDTLDFVVWKQYGTTDNRIVEKVLSANTGLSEKGPIIPTGTLITLPEITPEQVETAKVKLWD